MAGSAFDQRVELAKGRAGGEHHIELVQRLAGGPVNQDRIDLGAGTIIPLSS